MVHRGRALVLRWCAFPAWNVVLFYGLTALDGSGPARPLAVQLALLVRAQVPYVRSRGVRAPLNPRSGETLQKNGDAARTADPCCGAEHPGEKEGGVRGESCHSDREFGPRC